MLRRKLGYKILAMSWGGNSSVMISKCPWYYDVCRIVDSNLEVMCLTRIRLHYRTNHYSPNIGSKLELNTIPSHTKSCTLEASNLKYHTVLSYSVLLER